MGTSTVAWMPLQSHWDLLQSTAHLDVPKVVGFPKAGLHSAEDLAWASQDGILPESVVAQLFPVVSSLIVVRCQPWSGPILRKIQNSKKVAKNSFSDFPKSRCAVAQKLGLKKR